MRSTFLLALAFVVACGAAPPPAEPEANAPFPYTVDEIRAGCPTGRWRTYALGGTGSGLDRMTFVETGPDGAVIEWVVVDETGAPLAEPRRSDETWAAMREHAGFPASRTLLREESVTVPAGTFACRFYGVTDAADARTSSRYWFTTDPALAGPPIRMEIVSGHITVFSMALVAWGDAP